MKFTMPDELPTTTELAALTAQAEAEINVFQARHKAGDEFTTDEVERFEYLADAFDKITDASAVLAEAEQSSADKLSATG